MNVFARLALPLFDKQITTIVPYGCPVWSLSDSQPACMNIKKKLVFEGIVDKLGIYLCWPCGQKDSKVQTDAFLFDLMFMVTK